MPAVLEMRGTGIQALTECTSSGFFWGGGAMLLVYSSQSQILVVKTQGQLLVSAQIKPSPGYTQLDMRYLGSSTQHR